MQFFARIEGMSGEQLAERGRIGRMQQRWMDTPWSRRNHDLFPATARAHAVELVRIGFKLSCDSRFSGVGQAMLDPWLESMMKHAILRR